MKTENQSKILLSENSEVIELLKTKVPAVAERMTEVLTLYNAFEIELPKLQNVGSIVKLKDVQSLVTSQVENDIPENQLKVGGLKISRDKLTQLLELPDYSELEKAVQKLQKELFDSRLNNLALYEMKGDKIEVVDSVLQIQIERCRVYAEQPNQIEMFIALEQISKLMNEVVIPQCDRGGYISQHAWSIPNNPKYQINYKKLFEDAFEFNTHKRTVEINRRFIANLR